MNIHKSQLFWGSRHGTRVLTHPHIGTLPPQAVLDDPHWAPPVHHPRQAAELDRGAVMCNLVKAENLPSRSGPVSA